VNAAEAAVRGRPRDPQVDRSILDAVADLLAERGFDGVTMEAVASRAGVSKASVYRRYPCRSQLLTAACHAFSPPLRAAPDTGSTRDDLVELLVSFADVLNDNDQGRVLPALLGASAANPEARDALTRFTASRRSPTLEVIHRGIDRGDLPQGTDADLLADLLSGAIVFRVLVRGDRVGRPRVERYVDLVLGA
jgi:AcrR family transcriptional regulator